MMLNVVRPLFGGLKHKYIRLVLGYFEKSPIWVEFFPSDKFYLFSSAVVSLKEAAPIELTLSRSSYYRKRQHRNCVEKEKIKHNSIFFVTAKFKTCRSTFM